MTIHVRNSDPGHIRISQTGSTNGVRVGIAYFILMCYRKYK